MSANTKSSDPREIPVPEFFNISSAACDRWADGSGRTALILEDETGLAAKVSFDTLKSMSSRLANHWRATGVMPGDRVAILLGQSLETVVAHMATYRLGAIAVPLFTLFGPDALSYRLGDSAAKVLVTDMDNLQKVKPLLPALNHALTVYCTSSDDASVDSLHQYMTEGTDQFEEFETRADDAALIIYTSGTTGKPKGVLHAHRVLLGHLPGVEMSHSGRLGPTDVMWTPADWAWIGGLLDVLMPSLYHGIPVVARRFRKFEADAAFALIERHGVTCAFLPPTALRMLSLIESPRARWPNLALRSIASGGEPLTENVSNWAQRELGLTINEFYGQTECNMIVSSNWELGVGHNGSIGKAVPGHRVAIVDDEGKEVEPGTMGNIAVHRPDPVMFLRYWNDTAATKEKFVHDWLITGDLGSVDRDGYVYFGGRADDVITSAGYRIGPGPIEDCIATHPAVRIAVVVGQPDPIRTEIVKAYVVLKEGVEKSVALQQEIQNHVRDRLSSYEYPRVVEFIDEVPQTVTGKIVRKQLRTRVG